jgi:GT2 family glycosyltransferase
MNTPHSELRLDKPFVSVISLTHNRCQKVLRLIETLHQQTYKHKEIILVDNASSDGTAEIVQNQFPDVRLFSPLKNSGVAAYNLGLKAAKGKYILLIDDDGLPVDSDWIEQVINRFETNPKLGVVCCKIRMLDTGEIAKDNPQFTSTGDLLLGYPAASYNGTGAGIRACVLHEAGYYPEYFFLSFLELHLCSRIHSSGWEIKYFPSIEVWHDRPSGSVNRIFTYYGIRNYFLYVWSTCPTPYLSIKESLRYAGWLTKCILKKQVPASLVAKSMTNAFFNIHQVIKTYKPVSLSTWRYLFRIRMEDY